MQALRTLQRIPLGLAHFVLVFFLNIWFALRANMLDIVAHRAPNLQKKSYAKNMPTQAGYAVFVLSALLILGSCTNLHQTKKSNEPTFKNSGPKNLIFLIADGMGFEYVRAAQIYNGLKPLSFERFPCHTQVTTCSQDGMDEDGHCPKNCPFVTDSAAAATAMATGRKVTNGVVSRNMPGDKSDLKTILEHSKALGKSTGIVTTRPISDATPAAFASHAAHRGDTEVILESMFQDVRPNVVFGSDTLRHRELAKKSKNPYHFVHHADALLGLLKDQNLLKPCSAGHCPFVYGGFGEYPMVLGTDLSKEGLPLEITPEKEFTKWGIPHLSQMTDVALKLLSANKDQGFFVMVESGLPDIVGHYNSQIDAHKKVASSISALVHEMMELDRTVKVIVDFMKEHPDTLLVMTADHETGGLVIEDKQTPCLGQEKCLPTVRWTSPKYNDATGLSHHTGVNVPLYAYGQGAERFCKASINNVDLIKLSSAD